MYMKRNELSSNRVSRTERGESHAGGRDAIKMLKMKVDPKMYMKTKGNNIVG
jgi:hypothetical protein